MKFAAGVMAQAPGIEKVKAEEERVFAPLRRPEGIPPALLEHKLRLTVNQYVDNPKSEPKLNTARDRLARLRQEVALLKAGDLHEAMKAVEVQAILDCAEIVVAASLERKESRWGVYHYRVDYPRRNDETWRKFIVVQRDSSGRPLTSTLPVIGG